MDAGNAPSWLFSFVDLAFLLLIATTQLGLEGNLWEMGAVRLPRLEGDVAAPHPAASGTGWQLRVHPPAAGVGPFELAGFGALRAPGDRARHGAAQARDGVRLDAAALRARLGALLGQNAPRPLLAPHADSRSEDLLRAVALVEARWPGRRLAAVERTPVSR